MSNRPPNEPPPPQRPTSPQPVALRTQQITVSAGPLPAPEVLERYNIIVPGAAERIISMAERDAKHLQEYEKARLEGALKERRRGQLFGLIIGLAALLLAGLALFLGYEKAAMVLGGSTVVGLVSVFVAGRILRPSV